MSWVWDPHLLVELGLLALAFVLSLAVGVERSRKLKSAGLRTHVLVGIGSAIFTLISAYGFEGVLGPDVAVDPSRIAAQVVSGIGFLGAGVIFVRNNAVSGLTSAATIWVVAAIGMACGANMPLLAIAGTGLHLLTVGPLSRVRDRLRPEPERLRVTLQYEADRGALREVLAAAERRGLPAALLGAARIHGDSDMRATLEFSEASPAMRSELIDTIARLDGVRSVVVQGFADDD
ncbi:MgtC/SapB family protein [Microbacterium oxydans]|uniref:MgtC/SapB family protein n=1 Tax=Microbacterium oxydans TaxID=82380 RepID=UPI0024ADBBF6|nr:MgtC/SapB family protein [Microbacterium oxydans]